ncbi:MAG: hypothetical protein ABSA09_09785 [Desulfobaccales bacterium]|jgi:hypothetical protein
MQTIFDLIGKNIITEPYSKKSPKREEILTYIMEEGRKPDMQYEYEVFNFLFKNKISLGIQRIFRFESLYVDGQIELDNGNLYIIEIKYRMNWMKACQSGWQISKYLENEKTIS